MSKSVYSLVLMDDVVAQVDRLAYRTGTSRSNMINRILAEYVSYVTPEVRIGRIFGELENRLRAIEHFQALSRQSDATRSFRSSLSYKYNPTVRYSVELFSADEETRGELRVTLRTQSSSLIYYFGNFFKHWTDIETKYLGDAGASLSPGKYVRPFVISSAGDEGERLGDSLAAWMQVTDSAMKFYFLNIGEDGTVAELEKIYREYLRSHREETL